MLKYIKYQAGYEFSALAKRFFSQRELNEEKYKIINRIYKSSHLWDGREKIMPN